MGACRFVRLFDRIQTRSITSSFGEANNADLFGQFNQKSDWKAKPAFEEFVPRHVPMVDGIRRAILEADSAGPGLYGASRRLLLETRSKLPWLHFFKSRVVGRRRPAFCEALGRIEFAGAPEALPKTYHPALELCFHDGITHGEAAAYRNCPMGTIESRLARGRDRARDRQGLRDPPDSGQACPLEVPSSRFSDRNSMPSAGSESPALMARSPRSTIERSPPPRSDPSHRVRRARM